MYDGDLENTHKGTTFEKMKAGAIETWPTIACYLDLSMEKRLLSSRKHCFLLTPVALPSVL